MDEEILIQQIAQGDTRAFGRLVERYQQRLARFAARMLGDTEQAQDIVQETFLRFWRARGLVEGDLTAYLFRIARNLLDYFRSHRKTEILDETADLPSSPEGSPEASVQSNALAGLVRDSVQALPEPQRAVFILSHYEGMSYQEIAHVVGCPVGTVASRKFQAVETLRRRLKPWIEGEVSE